MGNIFLAKKICKFKLWFSKIEMIGSIFFFFKIEATGPYIL